MIYPQDCLPIDHITKASTLTRYQIPYYSAYVQAGFASPAESYIEKVCDLNELCISNPEATYFVRVASDSLLGDRIDRDDVLIIDCSRPAIGGKIVLVWLNGDQVVKRIRYAGDLIVLESSNIKYEPIYVQPGDDFRVFGVATYVFQKLK